MVKPLAHSTAQPIILVQYAALIAHLCCTTAPPNFSLAGSHISRSHTCSTQPLLSTPFQGQDEFNPYGLQFLDLIVSYTPRVPFSQTCTRTRKPVNVVLCTVRIARISIGLKNFRGYSDILCGWHASLTSTSMSKEMICRNSDNLVLVSLSEKPHFAKTPRH